MQEIRLDCSKPILWPDYCAFCGAKAEYSAQASYTRATGYYGGFYTQRASSINFPVCKKHQLLCVLLDWPNRGGVVGCFKAFIFLPGILSILTILLISIMFKIKGSTLEFFSIATGALFWGGMLAFLLLAPKHHPVRLVAADESTITLVFRGDSYYNEFIKLNPASNI